MPIAISPSNQSLVLALRDLVERSASAILYAASGCLKPDHRQRTKLTQSATLSPSAHSRDQVQLRRTLQPQECEQSQLCLLLDVDQERRATAFTERAGASGQHVAGDAVGPVGWWTTRLRRKMGKVSVWTPGTGRCSGTRTGSTRFSVLCLPVSGQRRFPVRRIADGITDYSIIECSDIKRSTFGSLRRPAMLT